MRVLVLLLFLSTVALASNWAVLVAGSNGYWNYRHQADVCHAYQILHQNGYPDDRIIVMMYDDIANNTYNPFKGNIINKPDGPNVYPGVLKDYTGDAVNPTNFLNVLRGNRTSDTHKVLESGPDDNVFVYFADHGAAGLIAFPNDYLYAHDLMDALRYMYDKKMYKTLVFYMEACESGSMFNGLLPDNMNIYATTAATPFESSYACYNDDVRGVFLGDVYSVNWLENSTPFHIDSETLKDQFEIDELETKTSTVCEYGNLTLSRSNLYEYLAYNYSGYSNIISGTECLIKSVGSVPKNITNVEAIQYQYYVKKNMATELGNLMIKLERESRYILDNYYDSKHFGYYKGGCHSGRSRLDTRCVKEHVDRMEKQVGKLSEPGLGLVKHMAYRCYK